MNRPERCALTPRRPAAATIVALCLLADMGVAAAATPAPTGLWLWDDGRAGVEFHPCGDALCGRIVWLKAEALPPGRPVLDVKNPDPTLRGRRVCGIDYITGVKHTQAGEWKGGRVYDFNGGSTFDLDIDTVDSGKVRMRGYKGIRALGANLTLVRASTEIQPCKSAS